MNLKITSECNAKGLYTPFLCAHTSLHEITSDCRWCLYQHQSTSSVAGCCAGLRCCTRMAREPHPQATAPQDRAAARRTDSNNHTHSSAGDSCSSLNRFKPHLGFVFLMLPIQKLALVYKRENWLAINFMLFQGSCMIDLQAVS